MQHTIIERAERNVRRIHTLIHTIFTHEGPSAQPAMEELMSFFSSDFSMVTTAGRVTTRDEVAQMFRQAAGTRPGLEISVAEIQPVWHQGACIAMRYKETHRRDGVETSRISVVLLTCSENAILWHYLHETGLGH